MAKVVFSKNYWYLQTPYGTFKMEDENTARSLASIIEHSYTQGKRDKVQELREALYIYEEIYK